jgi:spore coat protein U-like protein
VRNAILVALVLFCAMVWQPAQAQTCAVSSTALAFGTYAPFPGGGSAISTTATVTVVCNPGLLSVNVSYTISFSIGGGTSYALRSMGGPTPRLRYQVYRDNGDTQIWGDGTAGTFTVTDGYGLGLIFPITKTYTAYGAIAANTVAAIGSYADTIVMTITY